MNDQNKNKVMNFITTIGQVKDGIREVLLEEQSVLDNLPEEQSVRDNLPVERKKESRTMQESIYCMEDALDTCDLTIDYLKGAVK